MMTKRKVCMIGATAVGKTSLVARYVNSIFSDVYLTTVGVKIESCTVPYDGREVALVVWDLSGEDEFQSVQPAYVRGASGYMLVVDGTRPETLDVAVALSERIRANVGPLPFVTVVNKVDRVVDWKMGPPERSRLEALGAPVVSASAKTGEGVERAFVALVERIQQGGPWQP